MNQMSLDKVGGEHVYLQVCVCVAKQQATLIKENVCMAAFHCLLLREVKWSHFPHHFKKTELKKKQLLI